MISERLMSRKLERAEATGAVEIVTDNKGNILHLRGGTGGQSRHLYVLRLTQLVARGIDATEKLPNERPGQAAGVRTQEGSDSVASS